MLNSDPAFRKEMFTRYPELAAWSAKGDMGATPPGLTWHHNADNDGQLNLFDRTDHRNNPSVYNDSYNNGGRANWGGGRDGRLGHLDANGMLKPKYR